MTEPEFGSWRMTPVRSTLIGNGIVGQRDSCTTTHQENGIVVNGEIWNSAMPTKSFPQGNGNGNGTSSWTPVTPGKPVPQRSIPQNQVETENWEDLVEIYQDLLKEETLTLNKVVAQSLYPTPPPSTVGNIGNQHQVASTPNRNLNSTPIPNLNHGSYQPSTSFTYFPSEDPANWDSSSLLAAIVRPKKSSASLNIAQNTSLHASNRTSLPNTSTQVGSNSISVGSMVGIGNQQSHTFTSNKLGGGYTSKQLLTDGFPVPFRPCYNLNSPPRSEPDAASSEITGPLAFAPITPDTRQKHTDSQWVLAKDRHESQRNEDGDNHYNEQLHTIGDSTSSAVSTTQKEHLVSEEGDELGIDLNKTPQQKTPARRKKHRPKVIREGKPKKTATPKDPKNTPPNETRVKRKYVRKKDVNVSETPQRNGVEISQNGVPRSSGKRKYVRKKGVENSDVQQKTRVEEATAPVVETPAKSCKKQLNFDLEIVARDGRQDINLNASPRDIEQERRINGILERSAMNVVQNNRYAGVGTHQKISTNHMQAGTQNMALPELLNVPSTPMAKARDVALNVLAQHLTMKNPITVRDVWRNGYNQVGQQQVSPNLEPSGRMVNFDERRGIKRQSFEQMDPHSLNAMDSLIMYQKLLLDRTDASNNLASIILESHKKTKTQSDHLQALVSSTPPLEDNLRGESRQINGVYGNAPASLQLLNSCTGRVEPSYKVMNAGGGNINGRQFQPPRAATQNLQKHMVTSGMQPIAERLQRPTPGHGVNPVTAMISWNRPPATPPKDYSRSALVTYPSPLVDKKRTATSNSSNRRSNGADQVFLQLRKDALEFQQQSFRKPNGGPRKHKVEVLVEDITFKLEGLSIYDGNDKKQNALVPYKGNNAIIPFEPIKKRKPRPKVDLDPETDRLWRLLMGKEGSEATETLDKDKEKWWEDERRVFRGRADSFIARMHLVQGDRRFSRWKGSVVDSVIGVFLTQNVSDHLSSSAFMSLAAKFSPKSTSTNETCCQDGACILVEEPIETVLPNDSTKCHDKIERQPVFNQSSFVSCESSEHMRHHHISSTKAAAIKDNRTSEEVILSQDSLDSSTIQTVDEIRSSSGSNSEAEDQITGFETSKEPGPANPMQAEKVSMFTELFSHDNRSPSLNDRSQYMHHLPKTPPYNMQIPIIGGSISSLPSSKSGITEAYHTKTTVHAETLAKAQNGAPKQDSCSEDRVSAVDKQNCIENAAAEANSKEQNYASHEPLSGAGTNIPKVRKGTAEDEKKKAFDWDSLRKKVLSNGEKRERSKDAKDSLDYEALRRAHVNEISDAIRERGMNNLLADRIKDFLDRLVRDHESIDLEWLRDVPPDQAKDYLLSIRGLGLKSVECVRLLTLHHLAFPVDTNVGRIAVRLGWVPLQPLPESLQLHLLEMYPVLESIQKYLWPRLCKLDQLTLYELHYQMITFGKVFCTKSKPNCNACPMRAECRHFASAFASARLALPGPEEKRIVTSDAPNGTHTIPPVIMRPMSLPPAENNYSKDAQFSGRECEPIIEEPTTPEPESAELTLSDIEDQYYEDDDEIPTIKLDMNEFTMNLQKMQDSMEGDMSKALVALNPQAASIPTPKLKNVSRLRTEHQVYELPDSHPILKGLDKREPDDPSPYLLAIWTPGETATSTQPPERGCQSQESGMLCDRTTCFSCNCIKEANSQVVRGTILMPCRTAMHGSFPLNGTYFQVNEMFADHASSLNPIAVPRAWIWNLPRRTVYFGTSVSTIFKGLTTQEIQQCFWRGFVCVRGFDQKTRAPRPLMARLHFPASKLVKTKNEAK
ncbi:protein ROS1-like [Cynara cardunculus var. scolymus]|uniref:protein ROS1-like n=1 Tax=Cynara cardunculus var. scolymus TaxID=59895 RepID=UPI000D6304A9|nr:protein ROS1-like [Cynara cardunculus var. scolymus]